MIKYKKPISIAKSGRSLSFVNPETGEITTVDTKKNLEIITPTELKAYAPAIALGALGSASASSVGSASPYLAASLPAFAMSLPVALTVGSFGLSLYNDFTGKGRPVAGTDLTKKFNDYTQDSDATRVNKPIIISRIRNQSQSRPIGEIYINPALTYAKSVSMVSEAPTDSISPSPEASAENPSSSTKTSLTSSNDNNKLDDNNKLNKKGWRDKLADKVSNAIRGKKKPNNPEIPQNPNSPGRVVRRVLWETKGNNFGPSYQWRNWGLRSPLYVGTLRNIGDGSIGKGVGKVVGYGLDQFGEFGAGFLEGYNYNNSMRTDTTTTTNPIPLLSIRDSSVINSDSRGSLVPIGDYVFTPEFSNNTR